MTELFIEPLKYYNQEGKQTHQQNCEEHFQTLLEKSGVDADENRKTVQEYNAELEIIKNLSKILSKFKFLRVLLIIAIIIGSIFALASVGLFSSETGKAILFLLLGIGLIVGSSILLAQKIAPKIKDVDAQKSQHTETAEQLLATAWKQVAPLNALFTDSDSIRLIEKTIPEFSFDDKFTKQREHFFIHQYDFLDLQNEECSMVDTLSGTFAGNPFLFGRRRVHSLGTANYTGHLTITWTETYTDSQGNRRRIQRTQVLTATVTKPKPYYHYNTFLAYGCQAAPDLTFSRTCQHAERWDEKKLERKIKRGEGKLQRKAEKAMRKGGNFQEMANSEFDVLFGASDRDHEVQFRLMYTPLAQQNTVALITDKENFGDDFRFSKYRRFNVITSDHAQNWNMNTSASNYHSYDIDQIKSKFIDFNHNFFKSIFFDFAPMFSVPAYLEEPCASMEDIEEYPQNYTYYEHEVMANSFGYHNFAHEDSHTEAILKTHALEKDETSDTVEVTAYSYTTCERVDFVPVLGGDGRIHSVPVPWTEYIPVSKTSQARIFGTTAEAHANQPSYHGMNISTI